MEEILGQLFRHLLVGTLVLASVVYVCLLWRGNDVKKVLSAVEEFKPTLLVTALLLALAYPLGVAIYAAANEADDIEFVEELTEEAEVRNAAFVTVYNDELSLDVEIHEGSRPERCEKEDYEEGRRNLCNWDRDAESVLFESRSSGCCETELDERDITRVYYTAKNAVFRNSEYFAELLPMQERYQFLRGMVIALGLVMLMLVFAGAVSRRASGEDSLPFDFFVLQIAGVFLVLASLGFALAREPFGGLLMLTLGIFLQIIPTLGLGRDRASSHLLAASVVILLAGASALGSVWTRSEFVTRVFAYYKSLCRAESPDVGMYRTRDRFLSSLCGTPKVLPREDVPESTWVACDPDDDAPAPVHFTRTVPLRLPEVSGVALDFSHNNPFVVSDENAAVYQVSVHDGSHEKKQGIDPPLLDPDLEGIARIERGFVVSLEDDDDPGLLGYWSRRSSGSGQLQPIRYEDHEFVPFSSEFKNNLYEGVAVLASEWIVFGKERDPAALVFGKLAEDDADLGETHVLRGDALCTFLDFEEGCNAEPWERPTRAGIQIAGLSQTVDASEIDRDEDRDDQEQKQARLVVLNRSARRIHVVPYSPEKPHERSEGAVHQCCYRVPERSFFGEVEGVSVAYSEGSYRMVFVVDPGEGSPSTLLVSDFADWQDICF